LTKSAKSVNFPFSSLVRIISSTACSPRPFYRQHAESDMFA
jgi:hypothetical protein